MNTSVLLGAAVTVILGTAEARSDDRVQVQEVLSMMDTMAAAPGNPKSTAYHWSKEPGAIPIARAIAMVAPDREWAARMAVYAIHESGLSVECLAGDGKKSLGTWQLQGVPEAVACDPAKAAPVWLGRARQSIADCSALPASERMAELASGSCDRGRMIARLRESFVLRALAHALPPAAAPSIE
jgi:hypothetical protein